MLGFLSNSFKKNNIPNFNEINNPTLGKIYSFSATKQNNWMFVGNNIWFKMEKVIGQGTFGIVYSSTIAAKLDENKKFQTQEIDKVIKIQKLNLQLSIKEYQEIYVQIEKESQLLKNHGITVDALISYSDKENNQIIMIMDNCGTSLTNFLKEEKANLTFIEILQIQLQICNEYLILKKHNVIHRDLKPDNICVKKNKITTHTSYQVLLIDFGLASTTADTDNNIVGTPLYMAPEVQKGQKATEASDAYALVGIFGQMFLDFKDLFKHKIDIAYTKGCEFVPFAPYNLSNLTNNSMLKDNMDPSLLKDYQNLLNQLQAKDPEARPSIEFVVKFLSGITNRQICIKNKLNNEHLLTEEQWKNLETFKEHVVNFQTTFTKHSANYSFMNQLNEQINGFLTTIPRTHFEIVDAIYKTHNETLNNYKNHRPFITTSPENFFEHAAFLGKKIEFIQELQLFFKNIFSLDNQENLQKKFYNTNSSGIKAIAKLFHSSISFEIQLDSMCKIAKRKSSSTTSLSNFWSNSHVFGSGRHPSVQSLYNHLAELTPQNTDLDTLIKWYFSIKQLYDQTQTFSHKPYNEKTALLVNY